MANNYFQFKQFKVNQEGAAMKVCTDSCIFGAYTTHEGPGEILDIGTGTGLLTLMLAQRYPANIDSVEIEEAAFMQAKENFNASPWGDRIKLFNKSIQDFSKSATKKYDLIISNPPFFSNHLKSPDHLKNKALHNDALPFAELAKAVDILLAENGLFYILLPESESRLFEVIAAEMGINPFKNLLIFNIVGKKIFRIISAYQRHKTNIVCEKIVIKDTNNEYTLQFKNLLNPYYLHL